MSKTIFSPDIPEIASSDGTRYLYLPKNTGPGGDARINEDNFLDRLIGHLPDMAFPVEPSSDGSESLIGTKGGASVRLATDVVLDRIKDRLPDMGIAESGDYTGDERAVAIVGGETRLVRMSKAAPGKAKSILPPPTGLGWTPPMTVWMHNDGTYSTDFDIEDYRPLGTPVDVYVSASGSDANTGLTSDSPLKNLKTALALAESLSSSGDVCRLIMASGSYIGQDQIDPAGLVFEDRLWIVETLDGSTATVGIYSNYTWSKSGGYTNVYQVATADTFQAWVFDAGVVDDFGVYTRLTLQSSIANVDANPGSYYVTGGILYVHTADSRAADNSLRMFEDRAGFIVNGDATLFLKNVTIHGGNIGAISTNDDATYDPKLYGYNCEFGYSVDDGVDVNGGADIYFQKCTCIKNNQDGFNYNPGVRDNPRIIEVDCQGLYNGSDANNDQGSSLHYGLIGVSVNCLFVGAVGQGIADAEANRWCVGCTAGNTKYVNDANASRNASFAAFSLSKLWLDGCKAFGSIHDLLSQDGGELYFQNCNFTGSFFKSGTGIVSQYSNYSDVTFNLPRYVETFDQPVWPDRNLVTNQWSSSRDAYDMLGMNVTFSGTVTFEDGPLGSAAVLPGTSANYMYLDSPAVDFSSIGLWLYWDGKLSSGGTNVLAAVLRTSTTSLMSLSTTSGWLQAAWTNAAGGSDSIQIPTALFGTVRRSCAVHYYGGTISVFFDGLLVWKKSGHTLNATSYGRINVGRNSAGTLYYAMRVNSVLSGTGAILPKHISGISNSVAMLKADSVKTIAAAGTAYTLTASDAVMMFGTTNPVITVTQGTWKIRTRCVLKYVGATFAANRDVTINLSRTNNTPADITGSSTTVTTDIVTTKTGTFMVVLLPEVIYQTVNSDDTISIYGQLSALPSAGSMTVTEASIIAERIN